MVLSHPEMELEFYAWALVCGLIVCSLVAPVRTLERQMQEIDEGPVYSGKFLGLSFNISSAGATGLVITFMVVFGLAPCAIQCYRVCGLLTN